MDKNLKAWKRNFSFQKINPIYMYMLMTGMSLAVYIIISVIKGDNYFSNIFFISNGDFFMDFFNSVRDAAQGAAAYTERHVIYPPMANLIYLLFSRLTPADYNNTSFEARYTWSSDFSSIMMIVIFMAMCAFVSGVLIYSKVRHKSTMIRALTAFVAFFSLPILDVMERGNMMLICFIALTVYGFTYSSKSKLLREIGLLSLAFAFSLKLYPFVFGYFLLADKRYKDAIRAAVYGILMLILPCFAFGGLSCFTQLYENITAFSENTSTLQYILEYIRCPIWISENITVFAMVWLLVLSCCFAVSPFIRAKQSWKTWILGLVTIFCIPSLTDKTYNYALLIIPLVLLFNDTEKRDIRQWIYTFLMTVPFIILPFVPLGDDLSLTMLIRYCACMLLSMYAVADTVYDLVMFFKGRPSKG